MQAALRVLCGGAQLPSQLVFARADWAQFLGDLGVPLPILKAFEGATSSGAATGSFAAALQNLSSPDFLLPIPAEKGRQEGEAYYTVQAPIHRFELK